MKATQIFTISCNPKQWKNILKGQPAFVLGNAPSLTDNNLSLLNDFFSIGVNRILKAYTPSILYWQDKNVWRDMKNEIKKAKCIKVCARRAGPSYFTYIDFGGGPKKWSELPYMFYGPNSCVGNAMQLASNLGCSPIVLLGVDCEVAKDRSHFFGTNIDHERWSMNSCSKYMLWCKNNCPVKVINCGKIKHWPQRKLEEVIKELEKYKTNKQKLFNILSS